VPESDGVDLSAADRLAASLADLVPSGTDP
jgi:hypothetical protein